MFAFEGATDPAVWGEFFGRLGPAGFVLLAMLMGVFVVALVVVGFLLFWRGSEKFGFVGFGKEYQLNRIAQEKQAAALERTESAQEEIKALLVKIAPFAEALAQWIRASMQSAPIVQHVAPTNVSRVSSPGAPPVP